MDDTNPTIRFHVDPARVARYPNDAAWRSATRSMLENVGPRIQASGLLAIANVCCARDQGTVWKDWLPYLSGAMDEMFTKWGNDPATGYVWDWGAGGWGDQLEEVREAEAQGKYFLGVTHSRTTDGRAAAYGLTTMLLASQGRSSFTLAENYTTETRFPIYDRALLLGSPTGAYYRVGAAYRRQFSAGTVLVNPTLGPLTIALGAEYVTENGTLVTSVTLNATSGAILLALGGVGDAHPPGHRSPRHDNHCGASRDLPQQKCLVHFHCERDGRTVPVPARRRRLCRLLEPGYLLRPRSRQSQLCGSGDRRGRQRRRHPGESFVARQAAQGSHEPSLHQQSRPGARPGDERSPQGGPPADLGTRPGSGLGPAFVTGHALPTDRTGLARRRPRPDQREWALPCEQSTSIFGPVPPLACGRDLVRLDCAVPRGRRPRSHRLAAPRPPAEGDGARRKARPVRP